MDVLGMSAVSSNTCPLRMLSSGLTPTVDRVSHSLKLASPSPKSSTSLHCLRMRMRMKINAVLIEPTNLNESSLLEFGRLSYDLNPSQSTDSCINGKTKSSTVSASGNSLQFSGSVGEALNSHAKSRKARSLDDTERMRRDMIPLHQLRQGGFVENCLVYRQIFVIRSYEVGPDKAASINTILSFFQEMALCHVQLLGIAGDGFGATRAMNRLGLIWVVTKMQVDVERYPVWSEVIEIDSWVAHAGKNGMRRDWIIRSYQSGQVLARATSTWCMMHATTRRLSKIPDEVRSEIEPFFMDNRASAFCESELTTSRISRLDDSTAEHTSSQLKSTPADLDMNQHVNNLKYINWVQESIPNEHIKTHKLISIVLEYRRECHSTDIVESLTSSKTDIGDEPAQDSSNYRGYNLDDSFKVHSKVEAVPATGLSCIDSAKVNVGARRCCQFTHLLRTQDSGQQEILRGKTTWRRRDVAPIVSL